MALVIYDRVLQTGTANTTVSFSLSGTVTGYQSFAVVGDGNTTYYSATDGTNWETGLGTYASSGTVLTRTTVLQSSNSGSAVTFSGTVTVWIDYTASKSIYKDANGNITANSFTPGWTATATAAGTTNLTVASTYYQRFTGTSAQTVLLPSAATVALGQGFIIDNDSTGNITLQDNASGALGSIVSGMAGFIFCESNSTQAGSWSGYMFVPGSGPLGQVTWGTSGLSAGGGSITNATWAGSVISSTYLPTVTLGSTAVTLGTTVATFAGMTLNSPTFVTPVLGTPSSGTLTSCTGLPNAGLVNSSVTIGSTAVSLGTTVATFAGVTLSSPTFVTPALGTPASGVLTNATGLPLTTGVTGTLPIANGGTGSTSAATVAGTGITVSGTFPNQTVTNSAPGTAWQSIQTTAFNATAGNGYPVNTTSSSITATLPSSPTAGQAISFLDYAGTWGTNNFIINPNGNKFNGMAINATCATSKEGILIVYVDSTRGWIPYAGINASTPAQTYTVTYLVVSGGGGGGTGATGVGAQPNGGGGGGGGVQTGTVSVSAGTTYTITVGGSGSVSSTGNPTDGLGVSTSGGNPQSGRTGGSSGSPTSFGGGGGGNYSGGGGGGAAGSGGGAPGSTTGGNGGPGLLVPGFAQFGDTGNPGYYAGGGGGGQGSSGGIGGGGNGGNGNPGQANTGGGGGGGYGTPGGGSGGGSGVYVIKYAGSQIGTGGTVSSSGGYTYHLYTTSGTYVA